MSRLLWGNVSCNTLGIHTVFRRCMSRLLWCNVSCNTVGIDTIFRRSMSRLLWCDVSFNIVGIDNTFRRFCWHCREVGIRYYSPVGSKAKSAIYAWCKQFCVLLLYSSNIHTHVQLLASYKADYMLLAGACVIYIWRPQYIVCVVWSHNYVIAIWYIYIRVPEDLLQYIVLHKYFILWQHAKHNNSCCWFCSKGMENLYSKTGTKHKRFTNWTKIFWLRFTIKGWLCSFVKATSTF